MRPFTAETQRSQRTQLRPLRLCGESIVSFNSDMAMTPRELLLGAFQAALAAADPLKITGAHSLKFGGEYRVLHFASTVKANLSGTYNFNRYVGAQMGYRSLDVGYRVKKDTGTFVVSGVYFGVVARY